MKELVGSYCPVKTRNTEIKMRLILNDGEPTYQRPRRLSTSERDEVVSRGYNTSISKYVVLVKRERTKR